MADENKDKRRAIDMALGQIERRFGKGSIMKLGDRTTLRVTRDLFRFDWHGCGHGNRGVSARPSG